MTFGALGTPNLGAARFGRGESLTTIESIAVLTGIGIIAIIDIIGMFLPPGVDVFVSILSILTTTAVALYLWSPLIASITITVLFALSFLVGGEAEALIVAAIGVGLVVRLGWTSLIFAYVGVFFVATAIVAFSDGRASMEIAAYLIAAAVSGAVGFALRIAFARGRKLEVQLAEQAEQEKQAVLAERRWIAGELHDSIAHHLTVVSLHVQMLDDERTSGGSQEAIAIAARKAMADLRFVIDLADDGPRLAGQEPGDLVAAIDEAAEEFRSAGHEVRLQGDPHDERIPRAAEIILARIMRESATNALKYAGPGEIRIGLDVDDDAVHLTVASPLSPTPRRELSSSRTGIGRMAERVLGARGAFDAGEVDGRWLVSARLPMG